MKCFAWKMYLQRGYIQKFNFPSSTVMGDFTILTDKVWCNTQHKIKL